ncbi:hypothetical protein ACWDRR_36940 [Kitasatospora sp. NPDC003701]
MTDTISFNVLLDRLPAGGFHGTNANHFGVATESDRFVPPTLNVELTEENPAVTLISARGATGKSTLAEMISARKQVLLWRLNDDPYSVSGDAFPARLNQYVGAADGASVLNSTRGAFVVVDALDEARMRVSGISWNEYVNSLASTASSGHRLVLLGRERVLDDVWFMLVDKGIAVDWLEISHFDPEQRATYVDLRIGADPRTKNEAYLAARSTVLEALAGSVDGGQAESFVGYAPVLDAVAELLRTGNLMEIRNTFANHPQYERRIDVLTGILNQLLEREQTKTAPLAKQFGFNESEVYTPGEQLDWLTHRFMGGAQPALTWCPPELRENYSELVKPFLDDHTFGTERWASPVFSAYVAAMRFGNPRLRSALRPVGDTTGLLFEFVSAGQEELEIDEWQFAALHASLLAAERRTVEAHASIVGPDPYHPAATTTTEIEEVAGELIIFEGDAVHHKIGVQLVLDRPDALVLTGPLTSLSVVFPASVRIDTGGSVSLGPDCFVRCADLTINGENVQISRRSRTDSPPKPEELDTSAHFEVTNRFTCVGTLSGTPSTGAFELQVPANHPLTHPWFGYRGELEPPMPEPSERADRFINMLMNLMRNHGHSGDPAVFEKKLEGRQSLKGLEFRSAVGVLKSHGIVTTRGPMIYLTPEWASRRFSGKAREGVATLDEVREIWQPVINDITAVIRP